MFWADKNLIGKVKSFDDEVLRGMHGSHLPASIYNAEGAILMDYVNAIGLIKNREIWDVAMRVYDLHKDHWNRMRELDLK